MRKLDYKRIILVCACMVFATAVCAQDTDEFQRIARRIMDAYDVGDEVSHAPDSANLYGGAYLGAGSNGRAMPSGYITYLTDKLLITSQLSVDFSEQNTEKDVNTNFLAGGRRLTNTDILTRYEKQDFSTRLDYAPSKGHILTFGVIESLDHNRVNESSVKNGQEANGTWQESNYEEQRRSNTDLKLGALLQYIRDFKSGGRLTTRLNLKYNYKPTDVTSDTWAAHSESSLRQQHQKLHNFDPYAMIRFHSKNYGGFNFELEEKYTIEDMSIKDSETQFDFNTYSSLTTLTANYDHAWLSGGATMSYEHFLNDIDDHLSTVSHDRTYNDWMISAWISMQLNKKNSISLSFDRDISRPTYTQLYPFAHIGSSIGSVVVGNSSLEPSKSSQVKVSFKHKGPHLTYTHSLAYKRISDDISQVSTYDEASERPVKTWVNDARYSYLRYAAEGEMRYGRFSMTMGFHAQYLEYDGKNVSADDAWSYSFKVRPQLELPNDWTLATVLLYTGRDTHRYYYNRSNLYWSVRAVKQIGRWALYAFVQDILQPDREQVMTNQDSRITTVNKPNSRCLIVGCSYTF